ncbi:MAG: hypothetical protein M1819_006707 [Sarea resinae]|nr:MAG: hypothetical protein M1819_006707 [Sarea resinae]
MAFNFNWSPLTADSNFYCRARELLTGALNKTPKPPIIVDDILVNELNLGSVPPELEILEIGDLAEDRFRGIFKMTYSGDAFLTLKTKVQANPLNTYLSTKSSFASPQPLAAASGLTIPLQITLSDIRLSAFVILVFSRQKGLTLVFRNGPLESLKVSSTFDSIPFVREYLQREIEGQLRVLLSEELPAIIHRLSLRLWVPEYRAKEDEELARSKENPVKEEKPVDPLASPPQDPVDSFGHALNASEISSLSLDAGTEPHSLFSQKNLVRLATLTDSHRTLSLFTPSIRDAVFRAWAGPNERGDGLSAASAGSPIPAGLTRTLSATGNSTTAYTFSEASETGSVPLRPSLTGFHSAASGLSLGSARHARSHAGKKKKHRVVNLRRSKSTTDSDTASVGSTETASASTTTSEYPAPPSVEEREEELVTPPRSPTTRVRFGDASLNLDAATPALNIVPPGPSGDSKATQVWPEPQGNEDPLDPEATMRAPTEKRRLRPAQDLHNLRSYPQEKPHFTPLSSPNLQQFTSSASSLDPQSSSILEQAWMMKVAGEFARGVYEAKEPSASGVGSWAAANERDDTPPPAYGT